MAVAADGQTASNIITTEDGSTFVLEKVVRRTDVTEAWFQAGRRAGDAAASEPPRFHFAFRCEAKEGRLLDVKVNEGAGTTMLFTRLPSDESVAAMEHGPDFDALLAAACSGR